MADKKKNDILEEQRRAQREFLELKKMQHGEMEAPPKPSEVAILPKTPKEKAANFWFQYKWHTIAAVLITVVLAVLITQCATRTKYDLEVVYFTYTPVMDTQTEKVADYLEKYAADIDGNGEINVQVVNCSFSNKSSDSQYRYTMLSKVQAMLAADEKALLFITDKDSYGYLNNISEGSTIFEGEPYIFGEDFYKATTDEDTAALPEGLQISCRKVSGTVLEKKKGVEKIYKEVNSMLGNLKNNTPQNIKNSDK